MKQRKIQSLLRDLIFMNGILVISDYTSNLIKILLIGITLVQIYLFEKAGGFNEE